jgi:hypothetical protein
MVVAVGIAAFALLLLNAHALAAWAGALEPDARNQPIVRSADGLAERTTARGLDGPRAAMQQRWEALKAARWPDPQGPGRPDAQR